MDHSKNYLYNHENAKLSSFLVMKDSKARVDNAPRNRGAGFMPAVYQGVNINNSSTPIPNLNPAGEN